MVATLLPTDCSIARAEFAVELVFEAHWHGIVDATITATAIFATVVTVTSATSTAIITAAAKADQAFNLLAAYSGYESEPAEEAHEEAPVPAYA